MSLAAPIEYQGAVYILQSLGITPTAVNVNLICAQEINEWGWSGADLSRSLNPLATTQWTPEAVGKWNSVPVWIFSSLQAGAQACAETIKGYPVMLEALQTSNASLYFGAQGRAELYRWSGGSASYASDLQRFYGQLGTPPAQYLAGQQSGTYLTQVHAGMSTGGIIALALAAGAGVAGWHLLRRRKSSLTA